MQPRHENRTQYFREQEWTTRKFVLPLLRKFAQIDGHASVLEIGCGEAGNLKPFLDIGCERIVGVDKTASKIRKARNFLPGGSQSIELLCEDIYDVKGLGTFDVVLVRDTLEHIHGQERFMSFIKRFVGTGGVVFLGFPPWHNPFGGHQQMCKGRFISKVPYLHILPASIYQFILEASGEEKRKVNNLLEIKATGITIERFEDILQNTGYGALQKTLYFINPHYETKFGLKPRKQLSLISAIPYLRNFLITTCYYVVSPKDSSLASEKHSLLSYASA